MTQAKLARSIPALFIVVASVFFVGTMIMAGTPALTQNGKSLDNTQLLQGEFGSSTITASNQYTGTGSPLALGEWADSRNTTTGLSFIGTGTDTASIRLAEGWDGRRIYTYLYNVKDIESWTRNPATTYDGTANLVNNFGGSVAYSYGEVEVTNTCEGADQSGNWLMADLDPRLGGIGTQWDEGQTAYWQQVVNIPRGQISRMWVAFDYWAGTKDQDVDGDQDPFCPWDMVKIYANVGSSSNIANQAQRVVEISSTQIPLKNNQWNPVSASPVSSAIINGINTNFPTPTNPVYLRVGILNSAGYSTNIYNGLTRFRNIRLFVEALALPVQLNLTVSFDGVGGNSNTRTAIQNIGTTYGVGQLNRSASPSPWLAGVVPLDITSTFRTNATVQFAGDNLETVSLDMYQIIYGTNQKNTVTAPNSMAPDGSVFTVGNGTTSTWVTNFYDRPPQIPQAQEDYINYKFNGTKPSDWTFTSILDSQPAEKLGSLIIGGGGTTYEMPSAQAMFYGFWAFSATSPNYVASVAIPSYLYEGEQLRINGSIISSTLTNGYVGLTQAELVVKFPNGTVWSSAYRRSTVTGARQFSFTAIPIPTSGVQYVAGAYTAIITWNNTRSGLPLNETGCITRTFTVRHRTNLIASDPVILDVLNTNTALPLQVRYADLGGAIVSGATITFTNFESVVQSFSFVNDYYNYFTLLDCTNGLRGYNDFNVTATHPAFESKSIIIRVELVRTSNFTSTNSSASVQWNSNFNLVFHYIDAKNVSDPIQIVSPNNLTVTGWPGGTSRYSVDMSQSASGNYRINFNSSSTLPYQSYPLTINIKKTGCQGKALTTDVSITPRSTALNLIPVPDIAFGETIVVNANYKEVSSGSLIVGATTTAQIVGHGACAVAAFPNGTYRYSFDTRTLPSIGTYTLRVVINWSGVPYFANQTQTLSIRVIQRATQAYATETFDVKYWGANFTVPLYYIDVINGSLIGGSNVHIYINARDGATVLTTVNTATWIRYNGTVGPWLLTFNASHFGRTNTGAGFTVTLSVNWTSSASPYYINRTVSFVIKIDEAPTFLYIKDPSRQTVPFGSNHTITFNLINQRDGSGILGMVGNITVTSQGNLPNDAVFDPTWTGAITEPFGNGSYVLIFNITSLVGDYISFNISISMTHYASITNYAFTLIKIAPVPVADINPVTAMHLDQQMNVSIFYHLAGDTVGIPGATVTVQSNLTEMVWIPGAYTAAYDGSKYYNILFTPSFTHSRVNAAGSYSIFVNLTSSYGLTQVRVNFVVNPIPTNLSKTYFNGTDYSGVLPTYNVYISDFVNVSVRYENTFNSTIVTGATVILSRAGFSQIMSRNGATYNYLINTAPFGVGTFEFTISATRGNFVQATQNIRLVIQEVSTAIVIQLNNTSTGSFVMNYGESLVVAFFYNNTHNKVPIRSGSATLTGGVYTFQNSTFTVDGTGWWVGTINSAQIGIPGVRSMTLSVSRPNFQAAIGTFIITIQPIPTSLDPYNATGQTQSSFTLYSGQLLTLAVRFTNTLTSAFITGASMSVTSTLLNSTFRTDTIPWYNYTFSLIGVTPNVYTISISASKTNHTSDTTLITVTVLAIPTDLRVYDGNVQSTSYEAVFGQNVTFKLQLWDTLNNVVVTGTGFSSSYGYITSTSGQLGNYTLTVNTTRWTGVGIVQFTITATRANHVASADVITINIKPITTGVRVFINGLDRTSTLQETINFLETFSITVYFNNTLYNRPITGATVRLAFTNLTGSYLLSLPAAGAPGNYSNTFDSGVLGSAVGNQYIFDLSATLANYDSIFKRINIFYNPIPTALNVTYAGTPMARSGSNNTISVIYCNQVQLLVNLSSYLQGVNLTGAGVGITAVINQQTIVGSYSATMHSYTLDIQVNNSAYGLTAGLTHQVLIIGAASGYKGDTFSLLLRVLPIPSRIGVSVNGTVIDPSGVITSIVYLHSKLEIFAWFNDAYQSGNQSLMDAEVVLTFFNSYTLAQESVLLPREYLQDYFRCEITMDPTLLRAGSRDFYITATLENYETKTFKLIVNLQLIPVLTKLDMVIVGFDTISVLTSESFTLRVLLFENVTKTPFTDLSTVTVALLTDFTGENGLIMEKEVNPGTGLYTGVFTYSLTAPNKASTYLLRIRVNCTTTSYLRELYLLAESTTFTLDVNVRGGGIPEWVIYMLIGIIIGITLWFIAYQVRFKYPPMIRKIMDLRRAVARSKESSKIHPAKVMSREENIYNHFAKMINTFSFLQTRDSRYAAKSGGYAPVPEDNTKLEWEITAIEAPEMPEAGAKGLKKAKGYTVPESMAPVAAPAKPIGMQLPPGATPAAPVAKPAAPAVPSPAGAPVVKPVAPVTGPTPMVKPMIKPAGLAALPKPSVSPLKAVRPGMPGVKPAPGVPGAVPGAVGGESHENLYQQLVLLEQKRYKAERSLRDLDAKHSKGLISDDEHKTYQEKITGGLDKIKQQIADIRRKLISF